MRKYLLFVLAAVLLTGMILSTVTADPGGPYEGGPGPCDCGDARVDADGDGECETCDRHIPHGDGICNDE